MGRRFFNSAARHVGLALALYAAVGQADALRCGNNLVVDGDTVEKVRATCGEPQRIERRDILQRPSYVRNGRVIYFGEEMVIVPVELWTYNFGPNRFMRRLRFVNGRLEEIETLGYGYNEFDSK